MRVGRRSAQVEVSATQQNYRETEEGVELQTSPFSPPLCFLEFV